MDKAQLISEVKELLANAETEKALGRMAEFLQNSPEYRQLYNLALQARAQFRKTQRDELQGLASAEQSKLNYNQVTRQAFQIAEWLEEGNLRPEAGFAEGSPRRWPLVAGIIALLLILGSGGYWWYRSQQGNAEEPGGGEEPQQTSCPPEVEFDPASDFNILVMPFRGSKGAELPPHIAIVFRLDELKNEYRIPCSIKDFPVDNPGSEIATTEDADRRARDCKAELIIWGIAEKVSGNTIIYTRYKFVSRGDQLPLYKLKMTENSGLDTVTTISSIATAGILTEGIEESIKLLFGLIAHENENLPVAIEMLEKYETQDSAATLVKGMVLAQDYLASGQSQKAWESYNQVLDQHPNYALARNNRGMLNFQKGNYLEAAEDLSVALETAPDTSKADILELRGAAYLKADQLDKAKADLKDARELRQPDKGVDKKDALDRKIKEIDRKIEAEKSTKASAEAKLRLDPNNLTALSQKAVSSQRLGDYQQAIEASRAILRKDPRNIDAYVKIIQAYRSAGDAEQIEKAIRQAEAAGISRDRLNQLTPFDLNRLPLRPGGNIQLKKN